MPWPGIRSAVCRTPAVFCELADAMEEIEGVELRLAPYETAYIINLTGAEAERLNSDHSERYGYRVFLKLLSAASALPSARWAFGIPRDFCGPVWSG